MLIVRSSPLHGAGVFTTKAIRRGTRVLEYTGPRLTWKQCEDIGTDKDVTYFYEMDDGRTVIDGFGMAAFVNHSCDPNCESDEIDKRVWIIALREIKAGEELTYDYCLFNAQPGETAPCSCGTKNCRGTMFSEEEIARLKRLERRRLKSRGRHTGKKRSVKP